MNNPGAQTCFIATAAYGTPWEKNVVKLRFFRERYLLNTGFGKKCVDFYYQHSPPVARAIESHSAAKFLTRAILTPFVFTAGALTGNMGDAAKLLALLISTWMATRKLAKLTTKQADTRHGFGKKTRALRLRRLALSTATVLGFLCLFSMLG